MKISADRVELRCPKWNEKISAAMGQRPVLESAGQIKVDKAITGRDSAFVTSELKALVGNAEKAVAAGNTPSIQAAMIHLMEALCGLFPKGSNTQSTIERLSRAIRHAPRNAFTPRETDAYSMPNGVVTIHL